MCSCRWSAIGPGKVRVVFSYGKRKIAHFMSIIRWLDASRVNPIQQHDDFLSSYLITFGFVLCAELAWSCISTTTARFRSIGPTAAFAWNLNRQGSFTPAGDIAAPAKQTVLICQKRVDGTAGMRGVRMSIGMNLLCLNSLLSYIILTKDASPSRNGNRISIKSS